MDTPVPSPHLTIDTNSLDPNSSDCSDNGDGTFDCTVTLGEDESGVVSWSVTDTLGNTFSQSSGTISSSSSQPSVTISSLPCHNGSIHFRTAHSNSITVLWRCNPRSPATPVPGNTPTQTTGVTQSPFGSTPTQTMDAFCTDLYNHDYPAAYTLLSPNARASIGTESRFESQYYSAQCGQNFGATPHGTYQQFPVYIVYPTRTYLCTYYLFQDSDGNWEIYSVYCQ